ncbi:MAG: hypothetical protein R6W73_00560 [Candidatus Saliniplasma sp.]
MIQIICDENENPDKVGYSQHYGGDKSDWSDVNKVDGTHSKVYVAEGGHASYYTSGTDTSNIDDAFSDYPDDHSGDGISLSDENYDIKSVNNEHWLNFQR